MNIITRIKRKLIMKQGESITEVLVASLVIAFGSIFLATMVIASTRIIRRSIDAYDQYMNIHNSIEKLDKSGKIDDVQMKANTVKVTINNDEGGKIYAFDQYSTGTDGGTTFQDNFPISYDDVKEYSISQASLENPENVNDESEVKKFSKYFR